MSIESKKKNFIFLSHYKTNLELKVIASHFIFSYHFKIYLRSKVKSIQFSLNIDSSKFLSKAFSRVLTNTKLNMLTVLFVDKLVNNKYFSIL